MNLLTCARRIGVLLTMGAASLTVLALTATSASASVLFNGCSFGSTRSVRSRKRSTTPRTPRPARACSTASSSVSRWCGGTASGSEPLWTWPAADSAASGDLLAAFEEPCPTRGSPLSTETVPFAPKPRAAGSSSTGRAISVGHPQAMSGRSGWSTVWQAQVAGEFVPSSGTSRPRGAFDVIMLIGPMSRPMYGALGHRHRAAQRPVGSARCLPDQSVGHRPHGWALPLRVVPRVVVVRDRQRREAGRLGPRACSSSSAGVNSSLDRR
jgi:hypothetical protein